MQCHQCLTEIPEGTIICPSCDAILDQSFLAELEESAATARAARRADGAQAAPGGHDPRAAPGGPRSAYHHEAHQPAAGVASPSVASPSTDLADLAAAGVPADGSGWPPSESGEPGFQQEVATRIIELDPERDRATRITNLADIAEPPRPSARPRTAGERPESAPMPPRAVSSPRREGALRRLRGLELDESAVSRDFDATLVQLREAYRRLDRLDKAVLFTLTAMFVTSLLPWFYTRGIGLIAGVQDYGVLSAVFAALAIGAFVVRAFRRRRSGPLVIVEVACAMLATAVACYRGFTLADVGTHAVAGLYLTAVAGLAAVGAGLGRIVKG